MSGPHVVLGEPIGTNLTESGDVDHEGHTTETSDSNRLQPQTSAASDPAGTESLASSQTMAGATPLQESSSEIATTKLVSKNTTNEKTGTPSNSDGEREMSEKGGDQKEMIELQDGLVFLGTEKQTGKAIIKSKQQLQGGPYTQPKWRHSLPFMKAKNPPPPAPESIEDSPYLPDTKASWWSHLFFLWVQPIMALGAVRDLTPEDLYKLGHERDAGVLSKKLLASFQKRWDEADAYNAKLEAGEVPVPRKLKMKWALGAGEGKTKQEKEKEWREKSGKKQPSLMWALSDVFGWYFWASGLIKIVGDTASICTSLVIKQLIRFSGEYYYSRQYGTPGPNVGRGVGMAIGLFCLLVLSSLSINHYFLRSSGTGVLARSALISALYERSLKLTGKSRISHPNGKLINHISTDVSRVDFACGFCHMAWTAPIQFVVVVIILLVQLKQSALVGIAFLVFLSPVQTYIMKFLFGMRKKSMVFTDKRARLLQELLSGMKVVKLMAWERPFLKRIDEIRTREVRYIRSLLMMKGGNMAIASSVPVIAAILAFITYSSTQGQLQAAETFTALTLFQLLRLPLMIFPMTLSAIVDAQNALGRLQAVFQADILTEERVVDDSAPYALKLDHASFTWDSSSKGVEEPAKGSKGDNKKNALSATGRKTGKNKKTLGSRIKRPFRWIRNRKNGKIEVAEEIHAEIAAGEPGPMEAGDTNVPPVPGLADADDGEVEQEEDDQIFKLTDIDLEIPRGQLVAVVGAIGSGKSSLLSGIMQEMRRTEGKVVFGGTTALCSQVPWIINATVRENILFGRPFEEEKYWHVISEACLETDLELLPNGDAEMIGEKGINLSGGQKARVNLARAMYYDADLLLLDDILAAVDSHVAALLFDAVRQLDTTRILVTHALHFLPQVDYIITMHEGRVAERGTYAELRSASGPFAALIRDFANEDQNEENAEKEEEAIETVVGRPAPIPRERLTANAQNALASKETMATGTVGLHVYKGYLKAGRGWITLPLLIAATVISQGFTIMTSYWLVYWQEKRWAYSDGFYEGIYVALGLGAAFTVFLMGAAQAYLCFFASVHLHDAAMQRVMRAPQSFFDATPLGRLLNRLTKDIDTLDNTLADALRMLISTIAGVVGTIVLIAIVQPYFLIAVLVVAIVYGHLAAWYQRSALMFKRIDAVLRSPLYAHFSESLSGVTVIRAYGEGERFIADNQKLMAIETRAYYLTVANQRWLGIRLDALGSVLVFVVAIIVACSSTISPAASGLILSYSVTLQQSFSWIVRQFAEVQNDSNSVDRVLEYANHLEQEAAHDIAETKPPASWPQTGRIKFENVVMSYRPGLPPALKNLSLDVGTNEKVGIVGRTGAGKSTILTTLYRLVEVTSGRITIDDIDISKIGLNDLRTGLSILPQEPLLFSGTIRSNLDPFGQKSDQELWDAMRRAHLIDSATAEHQARKSMNIDPDNQDAMAGSGTHTPTSRFTLDSPVEDEGNNLSVGQRSLVSLARALVRDAPIVVLDEATAAVDLETDAKIQETIRREFKDKTLLCIAHRLRTILSYDKILVMDKGAAVEYDTPENLFRQGGIFYSMCDKSNITIEDIEEATAMRL
ncbi:hypothetical protein QFC24_005695 [Naganishia onofrii]|uniref:Uncharacterized protein n=1 Tax=Naganishia onofrii TaxID=1851511 RepID=A0ACC2X9L9_9TREE|nr:hypothetical protein QFC24_005695 [Naganishia onofrii]